MDRTSYFRLISLFLGPQLIRIQRKEKKKKWSHLSVLETLLQ